MARKLAFLLLLLGTASPAFAATRVTVEQVEQLLAAFHAKSDGKVAAQLSRLELTERASSRRLARWEQEFPGRRTREALTELADMSAFLELPAAEIPADPPPDLETQRQLLADSVDYVSGALSKLPNFYATRETMHFEDTPPKQTLEQVPLTGSRSAMRSMGMGSPTVSESAYQPLHKSGTYSVEVTYREGREVRDPHGAKGSQLEKEGDGLTTTGEFGPILSTVLSDGLEGKITWGHWEQGMHGPVAVFLYTVPQEKSHYMVLMPGVKHTEQVLPAYHGEIALDPSNGTILRLEVVSDMGAPYQGMMSAILVEYAPVAIGERTYMCPVKGVALSKMRAMADDVGTAPEQTRLNDISFTDYHLFRADTRILIDGETGSGPVPDAPAGENPAPPTPSGQPRF